MSKHLVDDLVPLYIIFPELFKPDALTDRPDINIMRPVRNINFQDKILIILNSDREDKSIVFKNFPIDTALCEADVKLLTNQIISDHGIKEWKIVVLTNEFHEHLAH